MINAFERTYQYVMYRKFEICSMVNYFLLPATFSEMNVLQFKLAIFTSIENIQGEHHDVR